MLEQLLDLLDTIPKPEIRDDEIDGGSGGNIYEAYDIGYEDGRADLAAEIRAIVLPAVREILEADNA